MKAHSVSTQAVAPVVYAVSTEFDVKADRQVLVYGTVCRTVVNPGPSAHITYIIKNRSGVELNVDADSIDDLIAALQHVRVQNQL